MPRRRGGGTFDREGGELDLVDAAGLENPSAGGEVGSEGTEAVDRAINYQMMTTVGRDHGLMAVGGFEDGEATHTEAGWAGGDRAAGFGSSMHVNGEHAANAASRAAGAWR
jgi:hypothetical protein